MCIMVTGSSVGSVSPELLGVTVLPVASSGRSLLHGLVTLLVHASGLLAGGGETALLSMSVLGGDNPVDAGIATDGLVGWVDHDDFKELEGGVLTAPVSIEHAEVAALAGNTLLGVGLVTALSLDLLDTTRVSGLTVDATLGGLSLTATSADADTVDNVSLLCLVAHLSRLIGAGGSAALVDSGKLTVLPGSDSENESAEI